MELGRDPVTMLIPEGDTFTHEARVDDKVVSICTSYRHQGSKDCPCGSYKLVWT